MRPTLFYDADQGVTVYGTWIDDGKHDFVINPDELDLIRWGSESPNVDVSPYENLKGLGDKIFLKSGKVIKRAHHRKYDPVASTLQLVDDDGIKQKFKFIKDDQVSK